MVSVVKLEYRLGLRQGDVKSEDCKSCVVDAGQELQKRCPYSKGAITWCGILTEDIYMYINCKLIINSITFPTCIPRACHPFSLNRYDYCLVKYSDEKFFGKIDKKNKLYLLNVADADMDFAEFNQKINDLLGGLVDQAAASFTRYASGNKKLAESSGQSMLYGLAQCRRDLSPADCKGCLKQAISGLPGCCYGKRGGRTVGGWEPQC